MATFGYADLPVPGGGDAPVGPGALSALAQAIDPHLLHHVADQAERDAQFSDAPLHTAVTAADGSLWIKTSATLNVWATVWEPDPEWRPLEPATGYQGGQYAPEVRRKGSQVWIRGRFERTNGELIPTTGVALGMVPADCIPQIEIGSMAVAASMAGDAVIGAGKLEVLDVNTASSLGDPGTILWWSQDGSGVQWVNVGGGTFWID